MMSNPDPGVCQQLTASAKALVQSIERSQTFARTLKDKVRGGDYLLTATLLS
jgi:hypothetical protein